MKDRVPTKPGRVKLTPVSGQANTYDMVRADQPTQEGTPLGKATLFDSGAEQAVFGDATGDHTPAEAFAALPNRIEPIGTIKTTVRTDLGDKWLLCNGDTIYGSEYRELVDLLYKKGGPFSKNFAEVNLWDGGISSQLNFIKYINGYFVVGGQRRVNNTYYASIAYAASLDGEWISLDLWSGSSSTTLNDITYANGYWVACGRRYYNTTNYAYIAYSTSISTGWATKELWYGGSNSYASEAKGVEYGNDGYWVVCGTAYGDNDNPSICRIAYAASPYDTWTNKSLYSSGNTDDTLYCIKYANGYWVAAGMAYSSGYSTSIFYTTSPSGTWTRKQLWKGLNSGANNAIHRLKYINGYWIACGEYYTSSYACNAMISYATTPSDTWTNKIVWSSTTTSSEGSRGEAVYDIVYTEGRWVVCGHAFNITNRKKGRLAYTSSFDNEWMLEDLWTDVDHNGGLSGIIYTDGVFGICGQYAPNKGHLWYSIDAIALPIVEGDFYAYIKAKEGFSEPVVELTLVVNTYVMPSFNGLTVTCPDGTTLHGTSDKVEQTVTFTFTVNQYGTYTAEVDNGKEGINSGSVTFAEGGPTTQTISV
ncbi:emp24/gp25L/p24 family protein [Oscillibacter sp. MSJ-2]|uniref:Emp24/gp25L/p24 family protein n=1 Tax=Dysosmobacter acutus TaxID=2841504 RepID=A0ABS6FBN0_9FIRM|nr:emp24/gp25L/p24 family protein [Dysosmobacter acutus]MBU5627698.1 emp24/gp25L/p24 family protein [Dysosmobacter acutus]